VIRAERMSVCRSSISFGTYHRQLVASEKVANATIGKSLLSLVVSTWPAYH
jgi:hypothetical protein